MGGLITTENLTNLLLTFPVFLFSLVFHEYAHAWMGLRRGDDLAKHMGRLTLNVLLSFAQFEREVTAERIRDKIAASKKKGLWMGGIPPLGYDPHPDPTRRELVVNAAEAETVRQIFELYATHRCLGAVVRETRRLGLTSKRHRFASGRCQGGAQPADLRGDAPGRARRPRSARRDGRSSAIR